MDFLSRSFFTNLSAANLSPSTNCFFVLGGGCASLPPISSRNVLTGFVPSNLPDTFSRCLYAVWKAVCASSSEYAIVAKDSSTTLMLMPCGRTTNRYIFRASGRVRGSIMLSIAGFLWCTKKHRGRCCLDRDGVLWYLTALIIHLYGHHFRNHCYGTDHLRSGDFSRSDSQLISRLK